LAYSPGLAPGLPRNPTFTPGRPAEGFVVEQVFPVSVRSWDELADHERGFFCFQDEYLPLHPNHAAQIGLLSHADATRVWSWAFETLPPRWPDCIEQPFAYIERCYVIDSWNDAGRRGAVRRWLFQRGVPFKRVVYLLYDRVFVFGSHREAGRTRCSP
jgi:hypothetical protein